MQSLLGGWVPALVLSAVVTACAGPATVPSQTAGPVELLQVVVVERRPHDPAAYTQGLELVDGRLYEGTGQYGQSTLREVERATGGVLRSIALDQRYFGEGIAVVDDRVIQLTWRERTAFVYRLNDFGQLGTFTYDTEGWGLCDDGTRLVISDGTSSLYFRDRSTFELLGSVPVTNDGTPVENLNELECVDGDVYANVNQTATIVRIDPSSGHVEAVIDASSLLADEGGTDRGVMNGIAFDPALDTFLLTGKLWSTLFEVRFVPQE